MWKFEFFQFNQGKIKLRISCCIFQYIVHWNVLLSLWTWHSSHVKFIRFWADVVLCVVYIKNRRPYHATKNKTPYEMWYGHIPSVRHLRVFGSTCYALILKEQRNKLGARSHKCIFLGYSNTSKAYCLYCEENKKFIIYNKNSKRYNK